MSSRTIERLLLGLVLLLGFGLRVWDLGRNGLWYDEILQAQIAGGALTDFFPQLIANAAMPLDYLVARAVMAVGSSEFLLRFPAAAFSTLAIAVIYALARRMFGKTTALLASAFMAVSGFAVFYAHEARPYSLYLLLVTASFYWMYRALQTNRLTDWGLFAAFIGGALLSHLFALFVALAQGLFILLGLITRLASPRRAPLFARISRTALAGGVLVMLVFLTALWLTPNAQFVWGSALRFLSFLLAPDFAPPSQTYGLAPGETIPQFTLDFFYTRILDGLGGGGTAATLALTLLAFLGVGMARRKPWETFLLGLWAILPIALIVLFLFYRATLFASRYLIGSIPAWLILCAIGVTCVGEISGNLARNQETVRRAVLLVLSLLFIAISIERATVAITAPKEDWRDAGQILNANVGPRDAVVTPGGTRVVFYYASNALPSQNAAEVVSQIADVENHAAGVWLVLNRYVFDPGGEIQAWLEGHGALALRVDEGITLYYWRAGAARDALLADAKSFSLPHSPFPFASLGEQFAREGDLKTAEAFFERAQAYADSNTERAKVNVAWGEALRHADRAERAVEKYRAALATDDSLAGAWIGLGRIYLDQDSLPAARDCLTRALALQPDSYPALYFLAAYYERRGDSDTAETYYARAAQILPDLPTPP